MHKSHHTRSYCIDFTPLCSDISYESSAVIHFLRGFCRQILPNCLFVVCFVCRATVCIFSGNVNVLRVPCAIYPHQLLTFISVIISVFLSSFSLRNFVKNCGSSDVKDRSRLAVECANDCLVLGASFNPGGVSTWVVSGGGGWVQARVVHGSISCDPTQPNPIQYS